MEREDEIRQIAYNIWEQEGCVDGHDCEHWFRAEVLWGQKHNEQTSAKNTTKNATVFNPTAKVTPAKKKTHK